jgi:hypothetical protein
MGRTDRLLVGNREDASRWALRCSATKKGFPRESGIPNYVIGIVLCAPKSNRAATHEYCYTGPRSQDPNFQEAGI